MRRIRPLLPAALLPQRNALAEQNLPLLNWFAAMKCKQHERAFGSAAAVRSELTIAYLFAIENWLTRDAKHNAVKLSTFIVKSLKWERARLFLRTLLIYVPGPRSSDLPEERWQQRIAAIRNIRYLRKKAGRCNDGRLLVYTSQREFILMGLKEAIDSVLDTLPYRQREIIKLRYGLGDGYTYTLEEVGRIFKVTCQRVRQIEARAMYALQNEVCSRRLKSFFRDLTEL